MAKNGLFEQLNEEDKAKVRSWADNAKNPRHDGDIPPELFIAAKLGYYYGWEARLTFGRGYSIGIDDDGKPIKIPYTWEEAVADVKAADKVHYRNLIDNSEIIASANLCSTRSKDYARSAIDYSNKVRKEVYG